MRNKSRIIFLTCVIAVLYGCALAGTRNSPARVSFANLVANPMTFDGMHVMVDGYMVRSFEERGLWISKAARDKDDAPGACLTLTNVRNTLEKKGEFKSMVTVTGTFRAQINAGDIVDLGACNDAGIELQGIRVHSTLLRQ
jgi:hypothetical protein